MQFRTYDTLTAAMQRAAVRPPNTIWLVLSIEGAAYYVFFSEPSLQQALKRTGFNLAGVTMQVNHLGLGANDNLLPSQVAAGLQGVALPGAARIAAGQHLRHVSSKRLKHGARYRLAVTRSGT
ncbi:hypothetical protein [Granulicella arctica]|uniref:hypothetical protein n=1 Tax=Granulicella arctica TaxID=940613 RepID=UPI0021DFDE3E|nr:hypothetical protein [Granulicella arctica]